MGYENEKYIKNVIGTESVFSHEKDKRQERIEELQEVYRKAKIFDDINKFLVEVFKQEEPLYLVDEYERGLYNAYYEIVGIIQEHMECADDEKYKNNNSKNDTVSKYNDRLDDDNIIG